jgi:4'-phosphopantetheinyl transferase
MISRGEIHIWHASTDTLERGWFDQSFPLSDYERQIAKSFRFERDRQTYVLSKCMIRTLLGDMLNLSPSAVEFGYGEYGKPRLEPNCGPTFSLAHAGTRVVCALATDRDVGVDIELRRNNIDLLSIAHRYFCKNEIKCLESLATPGAMESVFYKYWTLKEAYLKAEGSGLNMSMAAIDASQVPEDSATCCALHEDTFRGIFVRCLKAPPGYTAAVAAKGRVWTTRIYDWVPECARRASCRRP